MQIKCQINAFLIQKAGEICKYPDDLYTGMNEYIYIYIYIYIYTHIYIYIYIIYEKTAQT